MSDYTYKFDDGALKGFNSQFETRVGDNSSHHSSSYLQLLHLLLCLNRDGSVLDIGAGTGRATAIAKEISREVVALEPDKHRWSHCHRDHHNDPSCRVLHQTSGDFRQDHPQKQFDLVIVGMVLQHLATDVCKALLEDVLMLLPRGGIALIYTSHALEETKGFSFSEDHERYYISEEEFNNYANAKPAEQQMGLPVHRFSKQDLIESLPSQLDAIFWQQTAYYRKNRLQSFAKKYQVEPEKLKDTGHQQLLVAQKR